MASARGSSSVSLGRIIGVLVPIFAAGWLILNQANFLLGRSLMIAYPYVDATYRSAFLSWNGDVVAKDVRLPDDFGGQVRFERVRLETPGWFWFLRNAFDRKLKLAQLDRLHLTLIGGHADNPVDPSLGQIHIATMASASPFEAEGCARDGWWTRDELAIMGLKPGPTRLTFDFSRTGRDLSTEVTLHTPGVSLTRLKRRSILEGGDNLLILDVIPEEILSEHWEVEDEGFVAARNAFCARDAGISVAEFQARHVRTLERLLEIDGLRADEASKRAYTEFVRSGGRISFGGNYRRPMGYWDIFEFESTGEHLQALAGVLERPGQRLTVQWQRVNPRPLRGLDRADSTWAAIDAELKRAAPAVAATGPESDDAPVDAAPPAAVAVASAPVVAPTSAPAGPGASRPTTGSAADLLTVTDVVLAPTPPAPSGPSRDVDLAWADLPSLVGRQLRLWTQSGPPRVVELLAANGESINVRSRMGGGHAEWSVSQEGYRRARLVR